MQAMPFEIPMFAALGAGLAAGFLGAGSERRRPFATLTMAGLVVLGFTAQCAFPPVLATLQRSPAIEHGEIWRLVTTLFVQDGGVTGFVFNLAFLLALGFV